jgi:hypothetical protein
LIEKEVESQILGQRIQTNGVDFFEILALVCDWQIVIIMLLIYLICDFTTLKVNYTSAFKQFDIEKPLDWNSMAATDNEKIGVLCLEKLSDSRSHVMV